MTIAQEEIFGPVMSVITYNNLDEAIEIKIRNMVLLAMLLVKIKIH